MFVHGIQTVLPFLLILLETPMQPICRERLRADSISVKTSTSLSLGENADRIAFTDVSLALIEAVTIPEEPPTGAETKPPEGRVWIPIIPPSFSFSNFPLFFFPFFLRREFQLIRSSSVILETPFLFAMAVLYSAKD